MGMCLFNKSQIKCEPWLKHATPFGSGSFSLTNEIPFKTPLNINKKEAVVKGTLTDSCKSWKWLEKLWFPSFVSALNARQRIEITPKLSKKRVMFTF